MELSKLFEAQRELDAKIEHEHPRKPGEDRLAKKILALLVELGELANEWRGFKFWSNNQEPRKEVRISCDKYSADVWECGRFSECGAEFYEFVDRCPICGYDTIIPFRKKNPLLEEYVDCLHFILSIGNEINMNEVYESEELKPLYCKDIIEQFIVINDWVTSLHYRRHEDVSGEMYDLVFAYFLGLGEMLGFTWELVEEAYMKKNAVNHARQESGY